MSDTPFIVPEGLVFQQDSSGLTIEYAGTIELQTDLGGRIARLSSTGGDVVLHRELAVGSIEAAGQVRCAAGLEVGELVAAGADIGGALRATSARLEGALRCSGDLAADDVSAGEVHCAGLDVEQLKAGGLVETSGSVRVGRGKAGELRCAGDLHGDEVTVGGELAALGAIEVGALSAETASAGGSVKVGRAEVRGDLSAGGDISGDHVEAGGALTVGGDLSAKTVQAGRTSVEGDLDSRRVRASALSVGGDAKAGQLDVAALKVGGGLDADRVKATSLKVKGDVRSPNIEVEGAVDIAGSLDTGELRVASLAVGGALTATLVAATGALRLGGTVAADRLDATTIAATSGRLNAKVIRASEAIEIGAVPVRADLVMAPQVSLHADATGRISVVEAHNEIGVSKVKGCLSLEDLEDLFGSADAFLEERGVDRLGQPTGKPAKKRAAPAPAPAPEPEPEDFDTDVAEHEAAAEPTADEQPVLEMLETTLPEAIEPELLVEESEQSLLASLTPQGERSVEVQIDDDGEQTLDEPLHSVLGEDNISNFDVEIEIQDSELGLESDLASLGPADEGLDAISDIEPLDGLAAVQVATTSAEGGEDEDDLFGWADQMLTEVVAEGAINHPDAEDDHSEPTEGARVAVVAAEPELEPEPEPEPEPELEADEPQVDDDPIHGQMQETVTRIVTCYVHTEMPPAVSRLKDLVDARDYGKIRTDITDIWNQLLKFHQKRGMRIQPQVTTTFNTINSLVRKL